MAALDTPLPTIGLLMAARADRRVLQSFLHDMGYGVLSLRPDGDEIHALQNAALVIVDEESALVYSKALARLKESVRPVIMPVLVALSHRSDGAVWLRQGFDDLLRWPFAQKDLLARIETFLRLRRQSEEALRVSEAFSRSTLDAIAAHICVVDVNGRIRLVNRAWREFAQRNGAPLTAVDEGASYAEACRAAAIHPDPAVRESARAVLDVIEGRRPSCETEYPCHSPDQRRWFSMSAVRFLNEDARFTVVVHADITERHESELRFRLTFEMAGSGMAHVAFDGQVLRANQRLCNLLGYTAEELVGSSMRKLRFPGETSPTDGDVAALVSGEIGWLRFEKRLLRKDGSSVWTDVTIATARAAGEPLYLIAVIEDITERKRTEAALRESEARFRGLTELSSDWFWETDAALRFTRVEGTALSIPAEKLLGRRREDLPGHDETQPVWAEYHGHVAARRVFRDLVYSRIIDGERHFISISGEPILDPSGGLKGYRGTGKDITRTLRDAEELRRFRAALDGAADMVFLVAIDGMRILDFNDTACRMLGYSRAELLALSGDAFRIDRPAEVLAAEHRALLDAPNRLDNALATYRRKDGSIFPVEVRRQVMDTAEGPILVVNARDLTERRQAEQRAAAHLGFQDKIARFGESANAKRDAAALICESLQLVRQALCGTAALYVEPAPGQRNVLLRASAGLQADGLYPSIAPYAEDSALAGVLTRSEPAAVSCAGAGVPFSWTSGYRHAMLVPVIGQASARGALCALAAGNEDFGAEETKFLVAVASILSAGLHRIASESRLRYLAQFDELTGLANRTLLRDRFGQAIVHARRHGSALAALFIDLDGFKMVNDTLGHPAGDELLKETARRLQSAVRPGDTVARISGDEFAVVLADMAKAEDASLVAQKIIERIGTPMVLAGQEVFVTASIGIAVFPGDGADVEALLAAADAAMYRAKQSGRNGFHFFTTEINQRTLARVQLAAELRRALERREFRLAYQPKVLLESARPCAAEALLRWQHPERGMVSPGEFIPVLEETGLIVPVGEWALRQACADLAGWKAAGLKPLPVAVNLSARQFRQQDLHKRLLAVMAAAGIEPALIELEITESQLMHDPQHAIDTVRALSRSGIRIAIDDFGTGYSSLAYLTRFPVAALKIDRSFVANALTDSADATIVRTVIEMAGSLGFTVVAEGVETEEQANFLRGLGCEQAQGYFFARPMPAAAFEKLLQPA